MELFQASHQWATRPADQRFVSLVDLADKVRDERARSVARTLPNRALLAAPIEGDQKGLAVIARETGEAVIPTNWAFGQLAGRVGAPAGYLRTLPPEMAADCLNYGLARSDVEEMGVLLRKPGAQDLAPSPELSAVTGSGYGRIWNTQIADALVKRFGDGVTGQWRVPGEFGRAVEVTAENTTLFASDRDMFVFLADENHPIEMRDRRHGKPGALSRGFFIWNSEVGSQTLGVASFLFDYVCCNRIVWGVSGFKEIRIRHTSGAPDRWLEQVRPALTRMADAETFSITRAIEEAKASRIGGADEKGQEAVTEFLAKRFTRSQVKAIKLRHQVEEDRPIESLWDAVTGATAYAKSIENQDDRVKIEREAGKIMDLAASRV